MAFRLLSDRRWVALIALWFLFPSRVWRESDLVSVMTADISPAPISVPSDKFDPFSVSHGPFFKSGCTRTSQNITLHNIKYLYTVHNIIKQLI